MVRDHLVFEGLCSDWLQGGASLLMF
jgi:hypothetical protein